jgi:hypothetical protein
MILRRTDDGAPPQKYDLPEKATQTWGAGALVCVDTNGFVELQSGADQVTYWGVGLNPGQNLAASGDKRCEVIRLDPTMVFIATVVGAANADYVLLPADVYGTMGLNYDATTKRFYLDASEQAGADDRVTVLGLAPGSNVGDTNAQVYCKFLASSIQNY